MVMTVDDLERTAWLWDVETGHHVRELKGHSGFIESGIFSPDGKMVVTADDNEAIIWETPTGKTLRRLPGHVGDIEALAFSPDGRILVTGGQDGTTRLWVTDSGQELCRLQSFDIVLGTTADKGDSGWMVAAPDGRFDSNTLFDIRGMHWLLPDDPLKPLPLEAFLRDYYEPRLLSRLYSHEPLPALPDLSRLNRIQPAVKIREIKPETVTAPEKANFLPRDEKITLAEWLNYAVIRVPQVYGEMRAGRIGRELTEQDLSEGTNEKLQQPSLFDFARCRRDVLLVNNF